ncbi:transglycosylase SLT domain-containing protein [Dolichospermum planctonicum UHCC 0167]|uniref:transglycosylase SLT domain-containing protein n=1 Tax=Dolichospermum planctonicum TaxID=136072 RepID=UPI001443823A|nr:transglycosylase SLT domain-containing protein [Dolichospermum planctonicum]MCW9680174.1 transglycosylase SLT domain-containing protein [Dolichospermum planctonicum UHCC 0167]
MLKKLQKRQIYLLAGAGLCAFLAGAIVSAPQAGKTLSQWLNLSQSKPEGLSEANKVKSVVFSLLSESVPERLTKLQEITEKGSSPDRERARYLLASDYVETSQGKKALSLLVGLEKDYPVLAPYILLKQAQAHDILGEDRKASDLRQKVVKEYGKEAAVVKAIYAIAQPKLYNQAIAQFPSHPLTWEIIRKSLKDNSNQPNLQLILAKYAADEPGIVGVLDQLVKQTQLKPTDWELIGSVYWDNNQFTKAKDAYIQAPKTATSLYRIARGLQLNKQQDQAISVYKQLLQKFPTATETGIALLRLSDIAKGKASITYLDEIITKFPEIAPQALVKKATLLTTLKDNQSADGIYKLLIGKYSTSDEAAEFRWKTAQTKAKNNDYLGAWEWAQPITINNKSSILAPRAGFWAGKWATILGKQEEAVTAYKSVISEFPYSYYAWRSASILGLNVGNFDNLRLMNPTIIPFQRPVPPAGSETFKELYLLGQDRDAWLQWETEFQSKNQPSVAEEFTEGLMKLTKGEYLIGIEKIAKLEDREKPAEKAEYQALSQKSIYWQARYPFPYFQEIEKWSISRQLNPLLVTALMRQESRFQAKIKSPVGATGLMQVMPSTAAWIAPQMNADIKKINLENANDNIMLGTWYLDYTHRQYSNNSMLAIASYNAGPGNVAKWLQTIPKKDPDEFVEEIPFDETKNYVRQVFGNYWNYLRLYNPEVSNLVSKYSQEHPKLPTK